MMCGAVCGIVAAAPLALQLRRHNTDLGRGIVSIIGAFAIIQLSLLAVRVWWPSLVAPFGVPAVLAYLICVVVGVLARGSAA